MERLNRKRKEGLPSKWPNSFPSRPSPLPPCRLLQAGAQLRGDHAVAADEPQATSCFPSPSPRVWRLRTAVLIHSPLCSSSSSPSYARFHRSPRARRSAPPWQTWPPCPRDQAAVSLVLAVVDFFFPKQVEP